jgi:small nuclear ribonucleoprotein (snRNP)-like protein
MLMSRLKLTAAVVIAVGLAVVGGGALWHVSRADTPAAAPVPEKTDTFVADDRKPRDEKPPQPREQPAAPVMVRGKLESVDADRNIVTVSNFSRRDAQKTERTYPLARNVKVLRDGKEAKLRDLKKGGQVILTMSADQKSVASISVANATVSVHVKSVDATQNTITHSVETRQGKQDRTYQVSKDARILIEGKEIKLADLKPGTAVVLTLSVEDANTVVQIRTPTRRGGEEND